MNSRRDKKLQLREDHIIEAAARLIETVGFARLTMDMIAEETAMAKSTLYTHYKSKEAVAAAIVLRVFRSMTAYVDQLEGRAIDKIAALVDYMLHSQDTVDGYSAVAMRDDLAPIVLGDSAVQAVFVQSQHQMTGLIEQAKADGDIAPDLNNQAIMTMLFGTRALLMAARTFNAPHEQEQIIQHGIRIFMRGIRA